MRRDSPKGFETNAVSSMKQKQPETRPKRNVIMNEQNTVSRRRMLSGLGAGFAAAAVPSAFAQPTQESITPEKLQDPTTKYPKPPFKKQSQPWPGLASKMDPPPDHGENELPGLGPARRAQGADHRRRFRHGPRGGHRFRARRRRCRDQLLPDRGAGCARGHRADQGRRPQRARDPGRPARRSLLQEAGRTRRSRVSAASTSWSATPPGSRRAHRSSTSRPRISTPR